MNLTVEIPDEIARRLAAAGGDLSRRALEVLALEEYKLGRLTKPELRRLLGFNARAELDAFFKSHAAGESGEKIMRRRGLRGSHHPKRRLCA